jgi:hypothetical protein
MKRYVCTVATGLLLALVSTGPATAGLPLLDDLQQGTQSTMFGDQTVGEQKNEAEVTQAQGNGNVNIAPALAIGGDAATWNAQGNDNNAQADVGQSNSASQSQDATQSQELERDGNRCCGGQSQAGEQSATVGDQTVGEQKNKAEVTQAQGNGNLNVSPAIAVFGDASTSNQQGNGNSADATVQQGNTVTQSQSSSQSQSLEQSGSGRGCCDGQSQAGEQSATFGDQTVGEQKNKAEVTQAQGNGNLNVSPAIAVFGDATTRNAQGNDNTARADVGQSNEATQSQSARQSEEFGRAGGGCCRPAHGPKPPEDCKQASDGWSKPCKSKDRPKKDECCGGPSQAGEQSTTFGDQTVEKQQNPATVEQYQGDGNLNVSPAIAVGGKQDHSCRSTCGNKHDPCRPKCGGEEKPAGGDAATRNAQGNGNTAHADVAQSNSATQSQSATQHQSLVQACKEVIGL